MCERRFKSREGVAVNLAQVKYHLCLTRCAVCELDYLVDHETRNRIQEVCER